MEPNKSTAGKECLTDRYEKLYKMLLDSIPSSVLRIDRDTRILSANRNYLEKSQRTISNTIGCRLDQIFPPIILEQMNIIRQIHMVFESNWPTEGERMSYRAPGIPIRTYYYRILPFSWNNVVEDVILLMDDVTEQIRLSEEVHRVERHLASVFECASDMILSTDVKGRILSWNPAAEEISGYSFAEVKERIFSQYLKKEYGHEMKNRLAGLKSGNAFPLMTEVELLTKRKTSVYLSCICSPMKDELQQTLGVVIVGRNLTERRKLEIQLRQSQKIAALGVMAGGIAHEIRNPLAIASSAAQFLLDDDITPEFRMECTHKIHEGIKRAAVIIENLLRFARPSMGSEVETLDLVLLIQEAVILIANQARIQKIKLKTRFPKEELSISANSGLLQQVFVNLLLNGIKAMPDGGTLTVSIKKNTGKVSISIADTGHGISNNDIDKIFDPFYTTSPVGQGIGLGLSLCFSIVNQHSGSIEVNSTIGEGSTFTVILPLLGD